MKNQLSAFNSEYIIDGVRKEITPGQMLEECMPCHEGAAENAKGTIIDESVDRTPTSFIYDSENIDSYLSMTADASSSARDFSLRYPQTFTRQRIARTLIDAIWQKGHFRLENLMLDARWTWAPAPIGNMAAFYASAQATAEYIYDLGVGLEGYSFKETEGACKADFRISGAVCSDDEEDAGAYISGERACPATLTPDEDTWLIYIPFDPCRFKLGGSLLAQACGHNGGKAPDIQDPDYFMDCYEVVRELVEDGVIMSGTTVCDGGLLTAASTMCKETGIALNTSGIETAYQEKDTVCILFSEVPGILVQVDDTDYDYVDSQMLLQDIAYYPLGHPSKSVTGVKVLKDRRSGVADILAALMKGQSSEGED